MRIGVPKEIKDRENRVAITPDGVRLLADAGHEVSIQHGAGCGSGFSDEAYIDAGASPGDADMVWAADLVVKIKEPLESEYTYLRGQLIFTYFHLAGVAETLTDALLATNTTAIAYETVEDAHGRLPLLAPMSAVAGDMAVMIGAYYLARFNDGKGMLLGTVLGEPFGRVLVIGDGVVGRHAAHTACALGARTTIAGRHPDRITVLREVISPDLRFIESNPENLAAAVAHSDLVVGGVLLRGARAPYLVTEAMVAAMEPGSVIVDVSIDQGGCIETSKPTSHSDPVFTRHGVIHYCVTNMPGAYPRTSTIALTGATFPYVRKLADGGIDALRADNGFARGVNTHDGMIRCRAVAEALDRLDQYQPLDLD